VDSNVVRLDRNYDDDGWLFWAEVWIFGSDLVEAGHESTRVNRSQTMVKDGQSRSDIVKSENRLRRRAREVKASPGTCSNRKTGLVRLSGFAGRVKVYRIPETRVVLILIS
jgi:hypothetical protein